MIEKITDLLHILQGFALQTQFFGITRRKQAKQRIAVQPALGSLESGGRNLRFPKYSFQVGRHLRIA